VQPGQRRHHRNAKIAFHTAKGPCRMISPSAAPATNPVYTRVNAVGTKNPAPLAGMPYSGRTAKDAARANIGINGQPAGNVATGTT